MANTTSKNAAADKAAADDKAMDDLLAQAGDTDEKAAEDEFAGADDLLDDVEEDDSEGWVPTEKGEGIVGIVVKLGETKSDFGDDMCPTVTLKCKNADGSIQKWRVVGYGAVLKRELADSGAELGDMMAVKYWGEKPIKNGPFKGRNYKHYSVAVRKTAA